MPIYIEQFQRVKRYLDRIEDQNRGSTEYDDDLWSFFQNCWHLKDWIKNDPDVSENFRASLRSASLKETIKGCPNIKICADLANRTKHFELKNPWVGAKPTQRNVTVHLSNPPTSTSEHIITLDSGEKVVALDVAKKAVKEWQDIFAAHRLPI